MEQEEKSKNENQEDSGNLGPLLGLAGALLLALLGLGKAIKKIRSSRDSAPKTRCDLSSGLDSRCEFYVKVEVKSEYVSSFEVATTRNRDATRREPANIKYDIYQSEYDRTKFLLHEIYESANAEKHHKTTSHYLAWKRDVEPMMATPRAKHLGGIPHGYKILL